MARSKNVQEFETKLRKLFHELHDDHLDLIARPAHRIKTMDAEELGQLASICLEFQSCLETLRLTATKLADKRIYSIESYIDHLLISGDIRQEFGLETDSGSRYFFLRNNMNKSDYEAQKEIFESRGKLGIIRKRLKGKNIKKLLHSRLNISQSKWRLVKTG